MDDPARFGDWLKAQRKAAGLTQQQIADLTGIQRPYVIRIEKNHVDLPLYETRQRIHAALGTTEDDLIAAGIVQPTTASGSDHAVRETPNSTYSESALSDDDPLLNVVMMGAKTLTPDNLKTLAAIVRALQGEQGAINDDAPRPGRRSLSD